MQCYGKDVTGVVNGSSRRQLRLLCVALVLLRSVPVYRSGGCPGCLTADCMGQLSANSTSRVRSFLLALRLLSASDSAACWYGLITWSRSGADERLHM